MNNGRSRPSSHCQEIHLALRWCTTLCIRQVILLHKSIHALWRCEINCAVQLRWHSAGRAANTIILIMLIVGIDDIHDVAAARCEKSAAATVFEKLYHFIVARPCGRLDSRWSVTLWSTLLSSVRASTVAEWLLCSRLSSLAGGPMLYLVSWVLQVKVCCKLGLNTDDMSSLCTDTRVSVYVQLWRAIRHLFTKFKQPLIV